MISYFSDSEFEHEKYRPVLRFLNSSDRRRILRRMAKVSDANEDMDFAVREGGSLLFMGEKFFEKVMLGSVRKDPENLFRFPILAQKDWYRDSFIQNQLIEHWMSSDAPKEYLLAWLRFLPTEFGKRDRALEHFIKKAGLRSLSEWAKLVEQAEKVVEAKKEEEKWLRQYKLIKILFGIRSRLGYLFKSLPSSESATEIVEFREISIHSRGSVLTKLRANWALLKALSNQRHKITQKITRTSYRASFVKHVAFSDFSQELPVYMRIVIST